MDLETLTENAAAAVAEWFVHDVEGRRRLGFYAHHPRWWHLVVADEHRHGFAAQVEEDNAASIRTCNRLGMSLRSDRTEHQELVFELDLTSN